ncbi:MAG: hypothetical protein KAJ19_24795, partial [Gammaproteobacteria bacterium]|nr:hypothetical protein [Gammaproteobacteria bacterium]
KLLGLYLLTAEGRILVRVEREGKDVDDGRLTSSVNTLKEHVQGSFDPKKCEWVEGQLAVMQEEGNRILVSGDANFIIGAVLDGKEDEKFLADLQGLTNTIASMGPDMRLDAEQVAAEALLRQLLESRKYEGIDYVRDDPKLRKARFFEQVTLGLTRKAGLNPVLVVFDDLQWAEPSSLALVHYVARNTHEASVLLVGTYRIEEAESRPHLRDALKGMEQEDLVTEMDLKGLAQHDLADLAESFIGSHSLPDAFVDRLWRETLGNPLFVREVLRGLEEDNVITQKGGVKRLVRPIDQLALPERVREVIRTRLERLPKGDRRLLDAAATCGTRFTAALISKITGETKGKVLNGLNAIAQVHGLLRPTGSGFAFDHSAVQEVLYEDMTPDSREAFHKKAAEWLELAGGPLEDVAEHYYRSHSPLAVPKLRAAAEAALAQYANDEAARLLGEALELAPTEEGGEILELRADALEAGARYDEALAALDEALQVGAPVARCKGKVASVRIHQGLFDDALAACEEGYTESEGMERGQILAL